MQMDLDIAADDAAECTNQVVYLARVCTADGVGDTDPVDANLVNSLVNGQEVYEVGAERVL